MIARGSSGNLVMFGRYVWVLWIASRIFHTQTGQFAVNSEMRAGIRGCIF